VSTFKQFLEVYDELGSLSFELFFKGLGLSERDAKEFAKWWEGDLDPANLDHMALAKVESDFTAEQQKRIDSSDEPWEEEVFILIDHLSKKMRKAGITGGSPRQA